MKFPIRMTVPIGKYALSKIFRYAYLYIAAYHIKPGEVVLSNYLKQTYNLNLKEAALLVFSHSHVNYVNKNEMVITFFDPKIDRLASLITYGNGIILGSKILINAFGRD